MNSNTRTAWLFVAPAVAIMAVACLYPVLSALQPGLLRLEHGHALVARRSGSGMDVVPIAFTDAVGVALAVTTLMFAAV